jgi:hypothetical protein
MAITYEAIIEFMKNYCRDFVAYAQNAETTHRMNAYLAPDVEFVPFTAEALAPVKGRDTFMHIMTTHPSVKESIEPEDIIVDEKRKIAVLLLMAKLIDTKTDEVLASKHYFPLYQLVVDENNTLKIQKILFWEEVLPKGSVDFGDIFRRDPEMRKGFSL